MRVSRRGRVPETVTSRAQLIVGDEIGKGSFGSVYSCTIKKEKRKEKYALKELDRSRVEKQSILTQVEAERDIMFSVRGHPHVVHLYSYWASDVSIYMLMDFVEGGDMFDYVMSFVRAKKVLPPDEVGSYVMQMASGLDYIHSAGVVYRDLKLENILHRKNQRMVVLADFGLSKNLPAGASTKTICGTIQYMAPELLNDEPYSHDIDWWSLGVVAFIMMTGKYPHSQGKGKLKLDCSADDRYIMYARISEGLIDYPTSLPTDVQEGVRALLTKDASKRATSRAALANLHWLAPFAHSADASYLASPPPSTTSMSTGGSSDSLEIGELSPPTIPIANPGTDRTRRRSSFQRFTGLFTSKRRKSRQRAKHTDVVVGHEASPPPPALMTEGVLAADTPLPKTPVLDPHSQPQSPPPVVSTPARETPLPLTPCTSPVRHPVVIVTADRETPLPDSPTHDRVAREATPLTMPEIAGPSPEHADPMTSFGDEHEVLSAWSVSTGHPADEPLHGHTKLATPGMTSFSSPDTTPAVRGSKGLENKSHSCEDVSQHSPSPAPAAWITVTPPRRGNTVHAPKSEPWSRYGGRRSSEHARNPSPPHANWSRHASPRRSSDLVDHGKAREVLDRPVIPKEPYGSRRSRRGVPATIKVEPVHERIESGKLQGETITMVSSA